jgi:hypothetical protein
MLYYLLLFRSNWLLAFGADSGAGDELYLSYGSGSKWPISAHGGEMSAQYQQNFTL